MEAKNVLQWMLDNKYLYEIKGVFKVTNRFLRDSQSSISSTLPVLAAVELITTKEVNKAKRENVKDIAKQFMLDANIPFRVSDGNGSEYTVRSINKEATDEFKRIMARVDKGELDYQTLLFSTRLYYGNENLRRQGFSNYIITGTWEWEYNQFKIKEQQGNIVKHIQQNLNGTKFGKDI